MTVFPRFPTPTHAPIKVITKSRNSERRERIAEYPLPDLDDLETVPADEFYDNDDQ